jgi:hypothetical protein
VVIAFLFCSPKHQTSPMSSMGHVRLSNDLAGEHPGWEHAIHWELPGFLTLTETAYRSPSFFYGGLEWHLLIHPFGNPRGHDAIALYLCLPSNHQEADGIRTAELDFCVLNRTSFACSIQKPASCMNLGGTRDGRPVLDWGFRDMTTRRTLLLTDGFLIDGALEVCVRLRNLEHFDSDTGKVNQIAASPLVLRSHSDSLTMDQPADPRRDVVEAAEAAAIEAAAIEAAAIEFG